MRLLREIGTAARPLRASSLPTLMRCPMSAVLAMVAEEGSGGAADTGSAVHEAIRAFHTEAKRDIAAALRSMRDKLPTYPLADLGTAEEHFRHYAADPRNAVHVEGCEKEVSLYLAEEEIVIVGHIDQIRPGLVCDVKTGASHEGPEMLLYAAYQLAAYQCAIGAPRACIIRTRDYPMGRKRIPGPVFWEAPWTLDDAWEMMAEVARTVSAIRRGEVRITASPEACRYCPAGNPGNCHTRRKEICA